MKKADVKKTTLLLPWPLWVAVKRRALDEGKSLRAVFNEALTEHLGLKAGRKAVTK